jgi:curved DNA-binding protein CbpA
VSRYLVAEPVGARLLADCALRRTSGILTASRGKLKRLFCVEQGTLAYAASNLIEEQFAELLVRRGHLTADAHRAASEQATRQNQKLDRYLTAHSQIPRELLMQAFEQHVRGLLFTTLDWTQGECTFSAGQPDLAGELKAKLSCVDLLREYALSHLASNDDVRMRLGPPHVRLIVAGDKHKQLDPAQVGPVEGYLLERCDGSLPLPDLVGRAPAGPDETLRRAYALMLLGILQPLNEQKQTAREISETVSVEEVMARLKRAKDADYYTVLELNSTATRDEVRDAYYFLARRYHPDRFRTGPLKNLLAGIEAYFTQVTEAYNTLYDPERRAEHDRKRAADMPSTTAEPEQDKAHLARLNFARAKLLLGKGRRAEAVTFLENAVELDGMQALYLTTLGQLLVLNPRRRADAAQHLRRAIDLEPTRYEAYLALGQLYAKTGENERAVAMLREALRWEPGQPDAIAELKALGHTEVDSGAGGLRGLFKG